MNVLEVSDLRKTFGGFNAVDGVSFSVKKGDIHAVIGPNGAGKTTMFNVVSGHLRPTTGRVRFNGADITGRRPDVLARQGLTRAFQITTIFPRLTVLESVECAISARMRQAASLLPGRRKKAQREAQQLIESVGLAALGDTVASTLSHGDQRTLEVALALAAQPRLLLLDEPTAGMSPWETKRMVALVKELTHARDLTVLFCEHDMNTVFSISDRVTVMHLGQVIADGTPEEVQNDQHVIDVYIGKRDE